MADTKGSEPTNAIEIVSRWGLVTLATMAAIGALLRVTGPGMSSLPDRLDQTTLLYLGVGGGWASSAAPGEDVQPRAQASIVTVAQFRHSPCQGGPDSEPRHRARLMAPDFGPHNFG